MISREVGMLAACGAGVFALLYMRSLPFAYHIRFLGHCLWAKFVAEPAKSLFEETVLEFRCWPDDCDFNGHMGNSSYSKCADFGRYAHFARLGFTSNVSGANGGVYMRFKRALQPMQSYSLVTRVVCFDDKWVFIEHKFLGDDSRVKAAGLVKIVLFGSDGRQRKPAEAFTELGYGADVEHVTPGSLDYNLTASHAESSPGKTAQLVHEYEKKAAELSPAKRVNSSPLTHAGGAGGGTPTGAGVGACIARPGPSGLLVGVDCVDAALYLLRADAGFGKDSLP